MTLQSHANIIWQRRVQLLIGQDDGQWLDVSELRIRFHVEQALVGKPGHAVITVNNMANDTAQRIDTDQIQLAACIASLDDDGLIEILDGGLRLPS